jgi:hypothetical protein
MDNATEPAPHFSSEDFYRIVRGQIEHEDNLVGTRLNWFVASQSFLFTAYAIVVSNLSLSGQKSPWVNEQQKLLFRIIPLVAMFVCVLIFIGLVGAVCAMRRLRAIYAARIEHTPNCGPPPVQGYQQNYFMGQAGPLLLPPGFIAVWLLLLIRGMV